MLLSALTFSNNVAAAIISEFNSLSDFNAAVGTYNVIDFQGFSTGTTITDQYLGSGVNFTDGTDTVLSNSAFVTDGWGLAGNGDIHITFSSQMDSIGVWETGLRKYFL